MRNALSIASVAVLVVLSLLCNGAAFATAVEPTNAAIRFAAQENERCLTLENIPADALHLLGVDEQTAQMAMERDRSVLMVLSEGHAPINLLVLDAPDGIAVKDVGELDVIGRGQLLLGLGRMHDAQVTAWQGALPDFALCESTMENEITMHTLSLDTLYLGKIYSLRMEIIGRDVTDADRDVLRSAAMRMLRLGVAKPVDLNASKELQTPIMPVLTTQNAEVITQDGGVALMLEPVLSLTATNTLTIKGITDPKAKIRYQINGKASSSFSPNGDGSFLALAKNLKNEKDNKVSVTVKLGKQQTTHSFVVKVQWQDTPLALSQIDGIVDTDSVSIHGVTLPGSNVVIKRGSTVISATVDEEGRFSFTIDTRKKGNYSFGVESTFAGLKSNEIKGKLCRNSANTTRQKTAVNYQKLISSPKRFAGIAVNYTCMVKSMTYENSQPKCLIDAGEDQLFLLLCDSLQGIQEGQSIEVSGTLTGALDEFEQAHYPTLTLEAPIN